MMRISFKIHTYDELLNLHKALLEAKFHQNPDNKYVAGSPIIANICNDILQQLCLYDQSAKGYEDWTEWRRLAHQDFYKERMIANILDFGGWGDLEYSEKQERLKNYISPFTATEEEIKSVLFDIDKINDTL